MEWKNISGTHFNNNGYWKKLNDTLIKELADRCYNQQKDNPLESVMIQFLLVEMFLRGQIIAKLKFNKKRYFDVDNIKFKDLIDYYDLLGANEEVVDNLRKYNFKRNKIMHHALQFEEMSDLKNEAAAAFLLGQKFIESLDRQSSWFTGKD